jgi:hypothetical protein
MVSLNLAQLGNAVGAAAQAPGAATAMALSQAGTAELFSMGVLKKTLAIESSQGAQMAQLLGSSIDTCT